MKFSSVEDYISACPAAALEQLLALRSIILAAAPPAATELISYGIPTLKLEGNLVHYAAYKEHVGFYPGAAGIADFEKELLDYEYSKGTVRFPLDQPLPQELITRIVQYRVRQNLEKATLKKGKKKELPANPFSMLSAPAQRALANQGIHTLEQAAALSAQDLLSLHGMGPNALVKLQSAFKALGLDFKP